MLRQKKIEEDGPPGAPDWMLTFSDCMTLLLTFFVLLVSFSSFDKRVFYKLQAIFGKGLQAVSSSDKHEDLDALLERAVIKYPKELKQGSEVPTLDLTRKTAAIKETPDKDFRSRKIFVIASDKVFWGNGTAISRQGRSLLNTMAAFLQRAPGRVVVSECTPADDKPPQHFGLPRAWAVVDYLTTNRPLDKKAFSISTTAMLHRDKPPSEPMLEITILERSIYE